jgi:predicted transcriptional regulator
MKVMREEGFIKIGKGLIRSEGFISDNGERIPMTHTDKIIYIYIKDRVDFFVNKNGQEYFESHDTIAKQTNVSRATVSRLILKLIEHGVVQAVLQKGGRFINYKYLSVQPLNLYFKEKDAESSGSVKGVQDNAIKNDSNKEDDNPVPF